MMFKKIHGLNQFITAFTDDIVKLKSLIDQFLLLLLLLDIYHSNCCNTIILNHISLFIYIYICLVTPSFVNYIDKSLCQGVKWFYISQYFVVSLYNTQPHATDYSSLEIYLSISGEFCLYKAIHLSSHNRNVKTGQ